MLYIIIHRLLHKLKNFNVIIVKDDAKNATTLQTRRNEHKKNQYEK
jgi:hypothetical protein